MKKKYLYLVILLTFFVSACTFHFPYDFDQLSRGFKIIFLVEPDDAKIILNGKFIGEAYEFSRIESALNLSSRNNEIIIKKEGYAEEVIDLYEYTTQKITIQVKLSKEKESIAGVEKEKTTIIEKKPEYIAKTETEKTLPDELEKDKKVALTFVPLILEIEPEEAAIYINGKFWGISPSKAKITNLRLKPGKYIVEVLKPGYKKIKKVLDLSGQTKMEVSIKLDKE